MRSTVLSRLLPAGVLLLALAAPFASAPAARAATGDDYPYRSRSVTGSDPWGMTRRQCVSFVAWRLAQHGHPIRSGARWGNASHWDSAARARHYRITARPVVGAVAQWNAHERSRFYPRRSGRATGLLTSGGFGHVAYVRHVYRDGSALVEQYNMNGRTTYSTMRVRAPRYLHIGIR